MANTKEKIIDGKLDITHKCPGGCGEMCRGKLWHSHGRSFEDLACPTCGAFGRVDGHTWHPMEIASGVGQ